MKRQALFDKLISRAQSESNPRVNVADDVLEMLRLSGQRRLVSYQPLKWIAALSSAAAACIVVFAFFSYKTSETNAMTEFYQAISWVTQ